MLELRFDGCSSSLSCKGSITKGRRGTLLTSNTCHFHRPKIPIIRLLYLVVHYFNGSINSSKFILRWLWSYVNYSIYHLIFFNSFSHEIPNLCDNSQIRPSKTLAPLFSSLVNGTNYFQDSASLNLTEYGYNFFTY